MLYMCVIISISLYNKNLYHPLFLLNSSPTVFSIFHFTPHIWSNVVFIPRKHHKGNLLYHLFLKFWISWISKVEINPINSWMNTFTKQYMKDELFILFSLCILNDTQNDSIYFLIGQFLFVIRFKLLSLPLSTYVQ